MLKRHLFFTASYLLVCGVNFYSMVTVNSVLKLLAMPAVGMSMIFYFLISTKLKGSYNQKIFIGLTLAMAGDVEVIFSDQASFLFLAAVIATFSGYAVFIMAFLQDFNKEISKGRLAGFVVAVISVSAAYYFLIQDRLSEFKLPAIIHLAILALLLIAAFCQLRKDNYGASVMIFFSALLFLISDYSIGYSTFVEFNKHLMQVYLLSYQLALYLLVVGSLERKIRGSIPVNFSV